MSHVIFFKNYTFAATVGTDFPIIFNSFRFLFYSQKASEIEIAPECIFQKKYNNIFVIGVVGYILTFSHIFS